MHDDFIKKVSLTSERNWGTGMIIQYRDSPNITIFGEFEGCKGSYEHRHNGSGLLYLNRDNTRCFIYTYPPSEAVKSVFFQLPLEVRIGPWTIRNREIRKSRRAGQIRDDVEKALNGEDFPFDKYPKEADDVKCLLWGKRKFDRYLDYLRQIYPDAIELMRELEKLETMSLKETVEIIDKPLDEKEIKRRLQEAVELERFEEAAYYRDQLSKIGS